MGHAGRFLSAEFRRDGGDGVVKFRVGAAVRQKIDEMLTQGAVGFFFHIAFRVPPSDASFVPFGTWNSLQLTQGSRPRLNYSALRAAMVLD